MQHFDADQVQRAPAPSPSADVAGVDVQKRETARAAQAADVAAQLGAVQAKGAAGGASVPEIASQGVSGGGGALPHGAAIQKSFGTHDVSGINAHVGGAAFCRS